MTFYTIIIMGFFLFIRDCRFNLIAISQCDPSVAQDEYMLVDKFIYSAFWKITVSCTSSFRKM